MTSDKYTKDFEDFSSYSYPGQIMPHQFQHTETGGDGQPGLQRMIHGAMAAYGPYHVIEECEIQINGAEITGHTGYVMWSGSIISVDESGLQTLTEGDWFGIDSTGGYFKTGAKPTGVLVGRRIYGTNYDIRANRWGDHSEVYFPNTVTFYRNIDVKSGATISGDIYASGIVTGELNLQLTGDTYYLGDLYINGDITGTNDLISGYKEIDAKTGVFTNLSGHSDIKTLSNVDFQNTYHIVGASQISGSIISGTQITGTSGTIGRLHLTDDLHVGGNAITNVGNVDGVDISAHDGGSVTTYHNTAGLDWGDVAMATNDVNFDDVNSANANLDMNGYDINAIDKVCSNRNDTYSYDGGTLAHQGMTVYTDGGGETKTALSSYYELVLSAHGGDNVIAMRQNEIQMTAPVVFKAT